jgi:hypothetical protein
MIGGVVTSTLMELLVYPAIFYLWRSQRLNRVASTRLPYPRNAQLVPASMKDNFGFMDRTNSHLPSSRQERKRSDASEDTANDNDHGQPKSD